LVEAIRFIRENFGPVATIFVILVIWEFAVDLLKIPELILPKPSSIIYYMFTTRIDLLQHTEVTMIETIAGFIIGVTSGIGIAIIMVYSDFLRRILYPLLVWNNVVPKQALAPLLIIWFGTGVLPKLALVVLICFFPIVINTADGLVNVEPELVELFDSYKAGKRKAFAKLRFPNALPFIFSGVKVAITLAVVGAIVAEFVGGTSGLGYLIMAGSFVLDTLLCFAAVIILSITGLILFVIVLVVERVSMPWQIKRK
jgi:NitT/TauT family transport system permease protein